MAKQPAPSRGRTNDPEGLRRRLVDAAYAAFTTQGYHATSMHDLKREAGATGGALSHHFPTKKDLGLAVIRDRVADAVEETWIEPLRSAASASEGIQAAFSAIASELERRGAVSGCPLNNLALELSRHDPDFRAQIEAVFDRWREAIAERIRADRAAGLAAGLDPDAFATLVVAAYSGAMAMAKASQDAAPLRICAEQLARAMQEGRGSPAA
ncbi:TetR/AcrR family transcriptional regulator [Microvirga sp. GCM10011540]|uniref:TetR/AcrR family transcriptional regulator n=1 Tax=Microvirga sp. GCM10011540 TaxID=3317338 RepID=UPI003615FA8F